MTDATIVFNQTYLGQQVKNVTVWSNVTTDPVELQSFADSIRNSWSTQIGTLNSNDWSLDDLTVIYNAVAPVFSTQVGFTAGPLQGGGTADAAVSQVALLVSTSFFGPPPNRGRVYFAGLTNGQLTDGGLWNSAAVDAFRGLVESWADGVPAGENIYFLRIARRSPEGLLVTSSPVQSVRSRFIPATQRRRRIGQGS